MAFIKVWLEYIHLTWKLEHLRTAFFDWILSLVTFLTFCLNIASDQEKIVHRCVKEYHLILLDNIVHRYPCFSATSRMVAMHYVVRSCHLYFNVTVRTTVDGSSG